MASDFNQADFGLTIAKKRDNLGWSQEELAFQSGISRNAIQNMESGNSIPKADKINPLCDALGITPNELFGYKPEGISDLSPKLADAVSSVIQAGSQMTEADQKKLAAAINAMLALTL